MLTASVIISLISSKFLLPKFIDFLRLNNYLKDNYRGKKVINSVGIFLSLNILYVCIIFLIFSFSEEQLYLTKHIPIIMMAVFSVTFSGFLDDNSTDKTKGILGHMKSALEKEISAGSIKALIGTLISLIICIVLGYRSYNLIINFLLLLFSQNFINLLDLRPGRAIKIFIALSLICLPFIYNNTLYTTVISSVLISLFFYLPFELKEICIIGNTGANVLGIILGMSIVSINNIYFRLYMLVLFSIVQIYCEYKSLTVLIENNSLLNYIDMLGRNKNHDDETKTGSRKRYSK